jgi:hypothetical protein
MSVEKQKIPPRSEWPRMSAEDLYQVRSDVSTIYYGARAAGASYADQYLGLISFADALIARKEAEQAAERAAERDRVERSERGE